MTAAVWQMSKPPLLPQERGSAFEALPFSGIFRNLFDVRH